MKALFVPQYKRRSHGCSGSTCFFKVSDRFDLVIITALCESLRYQVRFTAITTHNTERCLCADAATRSIGYGNAILMLIQT